MRPAAVVLILILTLPAPAADQTVTADAPLATPKRGTDARVKEPRDRVPLRAWIPDGVKTVRGVIFNPFNEKQAEQWNSQEPARAWGFAVVGADYFGADAKDYGPSLAAGLANLAREAKRPELANAPILLVGMSAGAGMCMRFADQLPDRTLAVAAVCLEVGPTTDATRRIPTLTVFGEKEGRQMDILMQKLPEQRKLGARWAVAAQWGRRHEWGQANNLVLPFFDEVIRRRLPADADPAKGPVKLLDIPEDKGYCVVHPTKDATGQPDWFRFGTAGKDPTAAGWLPSQGMAAAWEAFVGRPKWVLRSPPPVGDGKELTVVDTGRPLVLSLAGVKGMQAVHVDLGGGLVGTYPTPLDADTAEVTIPANTLPRGVWSLVVSPWGVTFPNAPAFRPTVIVVR